MHWLVHLKHNPILLGFIQYSWVWVTMRHISFTPKPSECSCKGPPNPGLAEVSSKGAGNWLQRRLKSTAGAESEEIESKALKTVLGPNCLHFYLYPAEPGNPGSRWKLSQTYTTCCSCPRASDKSNGKGILTKHIGFIVWIKARRKSS